MDVEYAYCPGAGGRKNEKDCDRHMMAVKDALYVLNGKWKLSIILALTFDNYRFKELGRKVGVTPKMLSKELKELEMNQLITRTVWDTKPVTVEYAITPYGRTLKKLIKELGEWGEKHRKKIMTAHNA